MSVSRECNGGLFPERLYAPVRRYENVALFWDLRVATHPTVTVIKVFMGGNFEWFYHPQTALVAGIIRHNKRCKNASISVRPCWVIEL